jgi:peptide/nickel transport system permease protein
LDDIIMRLVDIAYAMPFEPLAIVLLSFLPPSIWTIILVVSLLMWRAPTRVIRAQVLSLSQRPFVKAAKISGASHTRILFYHIAPHVLPLSLVYASSSFGWAILAEASVSFLGFGDPSAMSWGKMLHYAFMSGAVRVAWWWAIPPGLCITFVVASVFFISRAYEEIIIPKLKKP